MLSIGRKSDLHNIFDSPDISITENDLEYTDSGFLYVYFKYNNNRYKLTVNDDDVTTQNLEVIPKPIIQDAVVKPETYGWNIIFNSTGNSYDLLDNGQITNFWWRLTEQEDEAITYDENFGVILIAESENTMVYMIYGGQKDAIMIDTGINTGELITYCFILNDDGEERLESLSGIDMEKYKWYYGKNNSGDIIGAKEYTGSSPIALNEFTNIISESYLQKIIDSFGNN